MSEIKRLCEEVEEYCSKATPGPWALEKPKKDDDGWATGVCIGGTMGGRVYANPPGGQSPYNDVVFMARARTDLPKLVAALREKLEAERWIPVSERLPEPYVEVLIMLVNGRITSGHLETSGRGEIITRPLTAPGEVVRQWPAWEVGDHENYHEATAWRPLPSAPEVKE